MKKSTMFVALSLVLVCQAEAGRFKGSNIQPQENAGRFKGSNIVLEENAGRFKGQ